MENGLLRVESSVAECCDSVLVNHLVECIVIPDFDLLDLVRGSEAVEEVEERNSSLDGGEVSYSAEVHYFLGVRGAEHSVAGLTTCVDIAVVTEDRKSMGSESTSRNVDNVRKQLTCDLVHIRDHQEKTL